MDAQRQVIKLGLHEGKLSVVNESTGMGVAFSSYEVALEVAQLVRYTSRGLYGDELNTIRNHRVRRIGAPGWYDVIWEVDGKTFVILKPDFMLALGNAIVGKAKLLEEEVVHSDLAYQQAILFRHGAGILLTDNKAILEEAKREAEWGDLRRYMSPPRKMHRFGRIVVAQPKKGPTHATD